jgi:lipopolysaccharide export system protein LptA
LTHALRAILALWMTLAVVAPAAAQGTQIEFGEGEDTSDQPVEVTAEQLEIDQEAGTALFTGDVLIVQGAMRLSADRVHVSYGESEQGENEVQRVEADGNVVFVNGTDAAEAERAVYTLEDGMMVMTGDVLLTRPDSAISGETLRVNVDDGTGVMQGRVSVTFTPEPDEGEGNGG